MSASFTMYHSSWSDWSGQYQSQAGGRGLVSLVMTQAASDDDGDEIYL